LPHQCRYPSQRRIYGGSGHYDDWSLYEIGLTEEQLRAATGLSLRELHRAWSSLPRDLRLKYFEVALQRYTHEDITNCQMLSQPPSR
jgi:hypothetical protein